jgi:16S rRNA (guanine(966)-N(2))-methyltransferase RsmD
MMSGPRVIAGEAKGRRLLMVPGLNTRPVSDRAKQALFNIIGPEIVGAQFLDIFAGTGSVGIEALSRGAVGAVFIEINQQALNTVHANLERTKFEPAGTVLRRDAFAFISGAADQTFDYVYVAPPQYKGMWKRALIGLDENSQWLNPDAWIIAQMHPKEYEELQLKNIIEFDQRRYGNTLLVFYEFPGS